MEKNNQVFFRGNLGKDSEHIKGNTKFSIAVWVGKDRKAMWLDVFVPKKDLIITKGTEVRVTGKLDYNEWEGKIRYQVIAFKVEYGDNQEDDFIEE